MQGMAEQSANPPSTSNSDSNSNSNSSFPRPHPQSCTRANGSTENVVADGAGADTAANPRAGNHLLSCTNCRKRKVKCNKTSPCTACERSSLPCVFPNRARLPRGRTGGSKTTNVELLRRLSKLEELLEKANQEGKDAFTKPSRPPSRTTAADTISRAASSPTETLIAREISPTVSEDALNKYIGSTFWKSLTREVSGSRRGRGASSGVRANPGCVAGGGITRGAGGCVGRRRGQPDRVRNRLDRFSSHTLRQDFRRRWANPEPTIVPPFIHPYSDVVHFLHRQCGPDVQSLAYTDPQEIRARSLFRYRQYIGGQEHGSLAVCDILRCRHEPHTRKVRGILSRGEGEPFEKLQTRRRDRICQRGSVYKAQHGALAGARDFPRKSREAFSCAH